MKIVFVALVTLVLSLPAIVLLYLVTLSLP
jgi:hypothetical protein